MAFKVLPDASLGHFIVAQSMSASIVSDAFNIKDQASAGIQLTWTGTPVGPMDVQVSIDHTQDINGNISNAGNWVSLPLFPTIDANGVADTAYIELSPISAPYIRVVYARVSGTGTLDGYVVGKAG